MKKYILLAVVVGFLGFAIFFAKQVVASQSHREWSNWSSYSVWGSCEIKSEVTCGETLKGTKMRSKTRVCENTHGNGQNECSYVGQIDTHKDYDDCEVVLPACEPEPVDACTNIDGFQEVIPEGYHFEEGFGCIVNVPQPGPAPEPVRVETPLTEAGAPVCTDTAPAKIPNIFVTNAGVGKLEVRWIPTGGDKAHIFYGLEVGKPLFSLIDTPNDGVEVIGSLESGKHYWFSVVNGSGCAWSSLSDWFDPIVE